MSRRWAIHSCSNTSSQSLPASEVAKQFGEKFAAKLGELAPGQWQGPVESGYGVHLVLVSERTEGRVPALAEVRDAVRREWANARRLEANEKFYQELLKRYVVTIERPEPAEEKRIAAARRNETRAPHLRSARRVRARRVRARGASGLSRTAPDRAGNLRRALEGAGSGREPAPRTLRGISGGLHERHRSRELRWPTTPSPNAGP